MEGLMQMAYTLGSLFDGSGGFPLAGSLCGIEPKWAAEIEPYPIAVTRSRFPDMKHLGSVTEINGAEIEPVDIITFGSPCQDLSVAGKRAGLKHEANGDDETTRSGLFMEAVRIIKEMREATNGEYPKFALWENVPGAFSSNKGEDFRTVLAELIGIVEPNTTMPPVPKGGWAFADCYRGDGWSLAYRVFDAQYWGVPQRRRRIHLVFHLTGGRAGDVLFEREGVRGYSAACGAPGQGVASDSQGGSAADDCEGAVPYTLKVRTGCAVDSAGKAAGKGALIQTDKAATLAVTQDQYLFQPVYSMKSIARNGKALMEQTNPICACDYKDPDIVAVPTEDESVRYIVRRLTPIECARLQGFPDMWGYPDRKEDFTDEEYDFWWDVRDTHAAVNGRPSKGYTKEQMLKWYHGLHTDSAEYKMWGNGIALPPALYCMQGIAEALNREEAEEWMY